MNLRLAHPALLVALALGSVGCSAESSPPREPGSGGTGSPGSGGSGNLPSFGGSTPGFGGSNPGVPGSSPGVAGSSPGVAGAPGGAGSPGTGTPTTCVPGAAKAAAGAIDNMEDGDNAIGLMPPFVGYWYIYNDGTGTQQPAVDNPPGSNPFYGTAGGATSPMFAACTKGSGFTMWGAGMGFNLQDIAGKACPIDASAVQGLRFQAKGSGTVRIQVASSPTASAAYGGTCTGMCDYHANAPITLTSSWSAITIPWTMLMPGAAAFDARTLLSVQFQAYGSGSVPPFEFCIDDIEFF